MTSYGAVTNHAIGKLIFLIKAKLAHVLGRKSLPGNCFRFPFTANLPAITTHLNLGIVANRYSRLSKFTINDGCLIV